MVVAEDMCDGSCTLCSPEDYYTIVDLAFLKMCKNMYDTLYKLSPDHTAPKWIEDIEQHIEETTDLKSRIKQLEEIEWMYNDLE